MSRDEANAVSALKNAWLGVVTSAQELANLAPSVEACPSHDARVPGFRDLPSPDRRTRECPSWGCGG